MFSKIKSHKLTKKLMKNKYIFQILKALGFHDYDLPLHKSEDSNFLILLIGLMSFLTALALIGMFALNDMSRRWSSGLENKVTIEIAFETSNGHLLSNDTITRETKKLSIALSKHDLVKDISVLSRNDISELISPWIGSNILLTDIPLPGIISLELYKSDEESLDTLKKDVSKISNYSNIETHHEWLSDLIKFTTILKSLACLITIIIGATTIIAIIAGIKSRLAIHKKEVNLLHHMGATDNYIARQFQRHAMILAFKGSLIGTILGLIITYIIIVLSMNSGTSLIPRIEISSFAVTLICLIPIAAPAIAILTSRFTVLHNLHKMP